MKSSRTFEIIFLNYVLTIFQSEAIILPYGERVGDSILGNGDDEVSEVLRLKVPLFFYDAQYYDLYIATNGIIFLQPPPRESGYVDRAFPLGFPAIAPFLADIDTSGGRGSVYYRTEESVDILNHVAGLILRSFPNVHFMPKQAVITTWDKVGRHLEFPFLPESSDKMNTFQAVLASDSQDSYALLLYPPEGLQFLGTMPKTSHSPGVELLARAGFSGWQSSTSEERSFPLPVQSVRSLDQEGNAGVRGLWLFQIGSSSAFEDILSPGPGPSLPPAQPRARAGHREPAADTVASVVADLVDDFYVLSDSNAPLTKPAPPVLPPKLSPTPLQGTPLQGNPTLSPSPPTLSPSPPTLSPSPPTLSPSPPTRPPVSPGPLSACGRILHLCSQDGYCTDHPTGPCCHCRSGYYGNGRRCLPQGVPQRLNGKVSGKLTLDGTEVLLKGVDLHGYAVVADGRVHVSVSPIPEKVGWALMTVSPLIGLFGWLFAQELQDYKNGFHLTGGEWTHQARVTFHPGKQNLTVTQKAQGLGPPHPAWVETLLQGELPLIPAGATVQLEPHKETYQYNHSVATSSSLRDFSVVSDNRGFEKLSYFLRQDVMYKGCAHRSLPDTQFQQLNTERLLVMYNKETQSLMYSFSNTVGPVGGGLPDPDWVNPCSAGAHYCDPMSICVPGTGTDYYCQCASGYRGDGRSCYDVDECSEGLDSCGLHSQCVNLQGSHHCVCNAGFEFDPDWRTCVDIDECYLKQCHPLASCSNSEGSFHCQCWPGYHGDGLLCGQSVIAQRLAVVPEPVKRPLSLCEQLRASLQGEGPGAWGGQAFLPQCDQDGQYLPLQCHGLTGQCWCVDSREQQRAGTRADPGSPPVSGVTEAPHSPASPLGNVADSMCERWRRDLEEQYGGQASPQDYIPQCAPQGHFLPVQCYGDSTFCWCVDPDGREVLGTRSRHVVKPACLPTVPSQAPQPLVHPGVVSQPPRPAVVFSQGQQITAVPLDGHRPVWRKAVLLLTLKDAIVVGMDYDCKKNQLYWSDVASQTISRVTLEAGAQPESFIHSGVSRPEGLAVCVRSTRLFWVDSGSLRIEVASLAGGDRAVLINSDLSNPRAIVVDSTSGTLFWTDWNRDGPRIESCSVSGQNRRLLVQQGVTLLTGLTLDLQTKHVCWADAGSMKVECIAPDGSERREIYRCPDDYPFSIVLHGDILYYTDWERDGVVMVDKGESNQTDQYLPLRRSHLYGITVVSSQCPSGQR